MGCIYSKEKKHTYSRPKTPANVKTYTAGDERNMTLLKFCTDNDNLQIATAINSGTDLASPYNGAPLIVSAVLALLNDKDHNRFNANWLILSNRFNSSVPIVRGIDVRLTNFIQKQNLPRETSLPVIHLGNLQKRTVGNPYPHFVSVSLGELTNCDLKSALLFIMSNIHTALTNATTSNNSNSYQSYEGSATQKMEKIIIKNASYVINNITAIEQYWNQQIQYNTYYVSYNEQYTMPPPPYTPTVQTVQAEQIYNQMPVATAPPAYDKNLV